MNGKKSIKKDLENILGLGELLFLDNTLARDYGMETPLSRSGSNKTQRFLMMSV